MTSLRASVLSVDITPHDFPDIRLGGFGLNRRARGILHPLEAGIVFLDDGHERVAIVSVDSVGIMLPWVDRIRDAVTADLPRERVLVCATHSHAAPDTMGYWGKSILGLLPRTSGQNPGYMDQLVRTIAAGVDRAVAEAAPARLAVTEFDVDPSLFTNHRKGGARDNRGSLVTFQTEDGAAMGCVLNFAAHPEGLWDKNRRVSPDYPHHVRQALRERGLGTPVFFSGALGGMLTPDIPIKTKTERRIEEIERIGTALGQSAADAAADALPVSPGPLRVARRTLLLPFANWRFRLVRKLGVFDRDLTDNGDVQTEMYLVRLGHRDEARACLQWLSIPGEALPELGAQFRERLGDASNLLLCLGCDELGYLLPGDFWDKREYAYECTMSVHRSAADTLLATAEELVAE